MDEDEEEEEERTRGARGEGAREQAGAEKVIHPLNIARLISRR